MVLRVFESFSVPLNVLMTGWWVSVFLFIKVHASVNPIEAWPLIIWNKFDESRIAFSRIRFNWSDYFRWDELGDIKSASFFTSWRSDCFETWSSIRSRLDSNRLSYLSQLNLFRLSKFQSKVKMLLDDLWLNDGFYFDDYPFGITGWLGLIR